MKSAQTDIDLEIRGAVERETRRSRHRDRFSRERVHPHQHDVGQLIDFVIDRRQRQPGAIAAVRRACHSVDTEALRQLVDLVLERGASTAAIRRCCGRVLSYCGTIEAALALRDDWRNVIEQSRVAVIEALAAYGDEDATAEVLARVAELPYEGDADAYAQAVAAVAREVWQRKLDEATARLTEVESQAAGLKAMNLRLPSSSVH